MPLASNLNIMALKERQIYFLKFIDQIAVALCGTDSEGYS